MASNWLPELSRNNLRLCILHTWTDYSGFGFNLDKSSEPPFSILSIDSYSPAAASDLLMGDIILSIDNKNVCKSDRQTVTSAIKNARDNKGVIELLVMEEKYYKELERKEGPFDPKQAFKREASKTMPSEYKNSPKNKPRTCTIKLDPDEEEFGFSLHYDKKNLGAYVNYIIPSSAASRTSLMACDRILEIDGEYVNEESDKFIKKKINIAKSKKKMKLFVVDTQAYKYFRENDIPLKSKEFKRSSFAKRLHQNMIQETKEEPKMDPGAVNFRTQSKHVDDIRLCTINRSDERDRLGFQLHLKEEEEEEDAWRVQITSGYNGRPSNAKLAGVQDDDYLIEINSQPIEGLELDDVKQLIRDVKFPQAVKLLVANAETFEYYKNQNDTIHGNLPNIKTLPLNKTSSFSLGHSSEVTGTAAQLVQSHAPTPPKKPPGMEVLPNIVLPVQTKTILDCYHLRPIEGSKSLGFDVQSNGNRVKGHKISKITPGSPAAVKDLPLGYYIISVNDKDVGDMSVDDFRKTVRAAIDRATIYDELVEIKVMDEYDYQKYRSAGNSLKQLPTSSYSSLIGTNISGNEYLEMRRCNIEAWPHYKQLGFNIVSASRTSGENYGHKIQELDPKSPAAHTHIQEGDYIIEVNGDNVEKKDLEDVDQLIHDTYLDEQKIELLVIDNEDYRSYQNQKSSIPSASIRANITPHRTPAPSRPSITKPGSPHLPVSSGDNLSHRVIDVVDEKQLLHMCRLKVARGETIGAHLRTVENQHIIRKVDPGSPAAKGGLHENDRIIQVNDEKLDGKSHQEVVDLIKNASQNGKIDILISPREVAQLSKYQSKSMSSLNNDPPDNKATIHSLYAMPNRQPISSDASVIKLCGDYSGREQLNAANDLGFELILPTEPWPRECVVLQDSSSNRGGFRLVRHPNHDTPIVAEVQKNSPAQRSGLAKGDHILYVDSRNIQTFKTFDETVDFVKRTFNENGQITFVVLTSPGYHVLKRRGGYLEVNPFNYQSSQADRVKPRLCKLKLFVDNYDFGFILQRKKQLFIQSIEIDSPADTYGLKVNDIVLELNGQDTRYLSMNRINEIIELSKHERTLDILVIDIYGYEFSIKHAIPINSYLSLVEIKEEPDNESRIYVDSAFL